MEQSRIWDWVVCQWLLFLAVPVLAAAAGHFLLNWAFPTKSTSNQNTGMPAQWAGKREWGSKARRRGSDDIYLSIVGASRNDNYGSKLKPRIITHVALMYHQLLEHCFLDAEMILVEWNPPPNAAGLESIVKEGLAKGGFKRGGVAAAAAACDGWEAGHAGPLLRLLTVDSGLHAALFEQGHVRNAPMAEYFAKNLGIRRARGRFVLATNPDMIPSPAMIKFLAGRTLHADSFYTASMRFDSAWPTSKWRTPKGKLESILKRVLDDSVLATTEYNRTSRHRPELQDKIVQAYGSICESGDDGYADLPAHHWDFYPGDFVIASKSAWESVVAYPEVSWTMGIDSSILCKFTGQGMRNAVLLPPCFVIHQHHDIGTNPNGVIVMDKDLICNLSHDKPLEAIHESQREPQKWGIFPDRFITEKLVEIGGKNADAGASQAKQTKEATEL